MRRTILSLAALILALLAVAPAAAQGPTAKDDHLARKVAPEVQQAAARGGKIEFLVVFDEQADLRGADALPDRAAKARYVYERLKTTAERSQAKALAEVTTAGGQVRRFALVNAALVTGDASLVAKLARRSDVRRLEPNPAVKAVQSTPEAPVAAGPGTPWGIQRVKAPMVWDQYAKGAGVVVGVADTGVEWTHPALQSHYRGWDGTTADHSRSWHDAIRNEAAPLDDYGHGSHVTGTAVGGGGDNRIGVAPDAKWIGCRNMDGGVGTPARYLECMEFMLAPYPPSGTFLDDGLPELGADIINNSWGCPVDEGCYPQTLTQAVAALRAAGILFVASTGNDGPSCSTVQDPPGLTAETFSVGAFSEAGSIATFSSRGPVTTDGSNRPKPDLAAPGVSVQSALRGGGYAAGSGTSMASPHVAGVSALLWSTVPALRGQVAATEAILRQSATAHDAAECGVTLPGRANNTWGWGEVDAFAAVQTALTLGEVRGTVRDAVTSQPVGGAPVTLSGPGSLNVTVTTDSGGQYSVKAAAGAYALSATALGYQATTAAPTIAAGGTTTQNVALTPVAVQTVGGAVTDTAASRPVRATVRVEGTSLQAATGADGHYSLSLPPGTYRLRTEAMGYQAVESRITVTGPTTADVSLRPAAPILIVDDDEGLEMQLAWLDALGALGRPADVFEVRETGSGPTADTMQNYCLVIWVVGQKLHHLRETDAAQLQTYLDRGGRLLLAEPGGASTAFHQTYLHVLPGSGPTASTVQGVGSWSGRTFDVALPAQLDFPAPALPAAGAQPVLAWTGQTTYGGIAYLGAYRTLYLTFGLQSLPIPQQTSFVQQALTTLGCPACRLTGDVNFDGRVDVTDIALVAAARGAASSAPAYQRRLDRNLDGVVDDVDVRVVAGVWGGRCQ